jgi:ribosomal protein S25
LLENKEKLHAACVELGQTLRKILQREKNLENDLLAVQTRTTSNIYRDTEKVREKDEIEKKIHSTKQMKDTIFDKIIQLDSRVKSIYLIIDQLGFNLSLAFNELRSEVNHILKNLDS